jgi:hypothetical protein
LEMAIANFFHCENSIPDAAVENVSFMIKICRSRFRPLWYTYNWLFYCICTITPILVHLLYIAIWNMYQLSNPSASTLIAYHLSKYSFSVSGRR